jgi:hypothetical protein
MPAFGGSPLSNCTNASNRPVEAPTPATGKFGTGSPPGRVRAGFVVTACRFATARPVFRGIAVGGNQWERRREVWPKRLSGILKGKWVRSKRSMSMTRMGAERITSAPLKSNVVRVGCGSDSPMHYFSIIHCRGLRSGKNPAFFRSAVPFHSESLLRNAPATGISPLHFRPL